ncbi:hypothetical protein ACROYT_G043018 [Oculina patagonica]
MFSGKFSQVVDLACFLIVGLVSALLGLVIPPFRRGFFCDDDSIKYPYTTKETLPTWALLLVSVILPVVTIIICEIARHYQSGKNIRTEDYKDADESATCGPYTKKPLFQRLYKLTSVFLFGSLVNLLFTLVGKTYLGELRPHFLALCKPNMSLVDCSEGYITDYECTGSDLAGLEKARRSFPSAHASCSMYGMLFLVLFFEKLTARDRGSFLKPFIQSGCIIVSLFFGLSRIRDHMHHWHDVLAGFLLGGIIAIYAATKVLKLFDESQQTSRTSIKRRDTIRSSEENCEFVLHSPDRLIPTTPR